MDDSEAYGPFAVSNISFDTLPLLEGKGDKPLEPFEVFNFDASASQSASLFSLPGRLQDDLLLPDLERLDFLEGDQTTASDGSVFSYDPEVLSEAPPDDPFDVWTSILDDLSNLDAGHKLCSWENFNDPSHEASTSAYLSEAGAQGFDAALYLSNYTETGTAIRSDPLLQATLALGMGRSSVFFLWNTSTREFKQAIDNTRIPGYSLEASQALLSAITKTGNNFRQLHMFAEKVYRSSSTFSGMVALARSIESILATVEAHLSREALKIEGFLQLAAVFQQPAELLDLMLGFVHRVAKTTTNIDLASKAFDQISKLEQKSCSASGIFHEIFRSVTRPCLVLLSRLVGLEDQTLEDNLADGNVDLPDFIDADTASTIHGLVECLQLLRTHHPEHALCSPSMDMQTLPLEVEFDWHDIDRITLKATEYERRVRDALSTYDNQSVVEAGEGNALVTEDRPADHDWIVFAHQMKEWTPLPVHKSIIKSQDRLEQATVALLDSQPDSGQFSCIALDLSLCSTLSFSPILDAQSRLVNSAVLGLVLKSNKLRAHLRLQHDFQLLGNGSFVRQLTSTLFDPSRATAERQKGVMRTNESMGLRLGSRKTWPPASSELQLALMGILADCYHASSLPKQFWSTEQTTRVESSELPGKLSFSVRRLPMDEAERCMDASSLYALDFLRLQYNAASPIDAIITTDTLEKYDAIFRASLRLQRMLYVVVHLPRPTRSNEAALLRLEMQQFVNSCAEYFFSSITSAWQGLEAVLDDVESSLRDADIAQKEGGNHSYGLQDIRSAHERALDRIMFAFFLRKRHEKIASLLGETFALVLRFANSEHAEGISGLRFDFKTKARLFIEACRNMKGTSESGQHGSIGVDRLLLVLDMNGHYSSR